MCSFAWLYSYYKEPFFLELGEINDVSWEDPELDKHGEREMLTTTLQTCLKLLKTQDEACPYVSSLNSSYNKSNLAPAA